LDHHVLVRWGLGLNRHRRSTSTPKQPCLQRHTTHADQHVAVFVLVPDRQRERAFGRARDREDADVYVCQKRLTLLAGHVHSGHSYSPRLSGYSLLHTTSAQRSLGGAVPRQWLSLIACRAGGRRPTITQEI